MTRTTSTRDLAERALVELARDTPDSPSQQIVLPGCALTTAMNLRGPAPALQNTVLRSLNYEASGEPSPTHRTVEVRFAGLGGYVLAKAAAVVQRRADKDLYDLAYILLHNSEGGAAEAGRAARAALPSPMLDEHDALLLAALSEFEDPEGYGPRTYARQRLLDGEDIDPEILAQDVVGAAHACRLAFHSAIEL